MVWSAISRFAVEVMRFLSLRPGPARVMPYPVDEPRILVNGPNPDRILFLGSGILAGLGVTTYRASVVGHAARQIAAITGRGVNAEVISDAAMTLRAAAARLEKVRLARYDAVVIGVGINDVFLHVRPQAWADGMTTLLERIEAATPASCCVFLIAIGDPTDSPMYRRSLTAGAAIRARNFNRTTARIAGEHPIATFLEFDVGAAGRHGHGYTADSHARWASQLVRPIAEKLDAGFALGSGGSYHPVPEPDRQGAVDRSRILDTAPEERFDRIVKMARKVFNTESATFAVIDRDRAWLKSSVGVNIPEIERSASFCNATIGERDGLEVTDALLDDRFAGSPIVTGDPHVRYYIGYPVESSDGYAIGAICVFDPKPRARDAAGMNSLRELAALIGRELDR